MLPQSASAGLIRGHRDISGIPAPVPCVGTVQSRGSLRTYRGMRDKDQFPPHPVVSETLPHAVDGRNRIGLSSPVYD